MTLEIDLSHDLELDGGEAAVAELHGRRRRFDAMRSREPRILIFPPHAVGATQLRHDAEPT
jgi:hypothetical protein